MKNYFNYNNVLLQLSILLVMFFFIDFIFADEYINTSSNYYNIIKVDKQKFSNNPINGNSKLNDLELQYLYYPDICSNTIINLVGTTIFRRSSFPGSPIENANLLIRSGTTLTINDVNPPDPTWVNILCIGGTLNILKESETWLNVGAIIILPGGKLLSQSTIQFKDLSSDEGIIDPFGYFPGILALGGTLSLTYPTSILFKVSRISNKTLKILNLSDDDKFNLETQFGYQWLVYSELFIDGKLISDFIMEGDNFDEITLGDTDSQTIQFSEIDNNFNVVLIPLTSYQSITSLSSTTNSASIYITNETIVTIENFSFNSLGKTKNEPYDDTILNLEDNNSIIIGNNQRYRNTLFIEYSSQVTIKGCFFQDTFSTRSPLVFYASNAILIGNLISSKSSGSNLIAQYGTENIQSISNSYYSNYSPPPPSTSTTTSSSEGIMDYGNEGNGIYSLSPNITSSNDVFIGQLIAFNFNFIGNRSIVIGYKQDCYCPCTKSSNLVSNLIQYPVEFKILNPIHKGGTGDSTTGSGGYLIHIDNNGNEPSGYFTINNLNISNKIKANLKGSALILSGLVASSNNFNLNGTMTRLDIKNSNIISTTASNLLSSSSSTTSIIKNTYIYTIMGEPTSTTINSIIYGSLITPYYYNKLSTLSIFKINSISPNSPYQIRRNSTIQFKVKLDFIDTTTTTIGINNISCIFYNQPIDTTTTSTSTSSSGSDNNNLIGPIKGLINQDDSTCYFIFTTQNLTGSINIRVKIIQDGQEADDGQSFYYIIDFPSITIFDYYKFYSGWKIIEESSQVPAPTPEGEVINKLQQIDEVIENDIILINNHTFFNGCKKELNCTILTNFENLKYQLNLPNLTESNELNQLFSSGISSNDSMSLPISIQVGIDSNATRNQFQLFFTYFKPINTYYSSLLSVYINNEPIYLLEQMPSNVDSSFKNITFYYDNYNKLSFADLSFTTRGDIYLTSLSIYSSIEPPPDIEITPTPTPTITFPPTTTSSSSSSSQSSSSSSNDTTIITNPSSSNSNNTSKVLTISLSVTLGTIFIVAILSLIIFIKRNRLKKTRKLIKIIKKHDIEEQPNFANNNKHDDNGDINSYQNPMVAYTNQFQQQSDDTTNSGGGGVNGSNDIVKLKPSILSVLSIQENSGNGNGMVVEKYKTHPDILTCMQESRYFSNDSLEFPLSFSKTMLDFGMNGNKCLIGEAYLDTLEITNNSLSTLQILLVLPSNNSNSSNNGFSSALCSSDHTLFQILPGEIKLINIVVTLNCTTKWLEKFAIQICNTTNNSSSNLIHTFLSMHLESELSTKLDFQEINFYEIVGEGTYGMVYRASWRDQLVAVKLMKVNLINVEEVCRELDILGKIRHPNIVSFVGGVVSKENLCIVTEFAKNGSLSNLIHAGAGGGSGGSASNNKLTMKQKIRFGIDIAKGCNYLHQCGIIHRDLKPDNVLVIDSNPDAVVCLKITDFGTSKEITEFYDNQLLTGSVGTPIYMSNQILEKKMYDFSTDVYSFGVLFYEILIEDIPFSEVENVWEIPIMVVSGWRPTKGLNEIIENYNLPQLVKLINDCWAPNNRPNFSQIILLLEDLYSKLQ